MSEETLERNSGILIPLLAILLVLPYSSPAADNQKMLHVDWRPIAPEYPEGSFERSTRSVWRLGEKFVRVEEAPDPAKGLHLLMIIAEPHAWLINLYDKTARHIVDPGPTFVARYPLFPWESSAKVKELEIGREIAFFNERDANVLPDASIDDVECRILQLEIESRILTLYIAKTSSLPFQIETRGGPINATIRYEKYETDLEPDLSKFEPPSEVSIIEPANP